MIEIHKIEKLPYKTTWEDLCANIVEDGRRFFAVSHDSQYSCSGIIINYENNLKNENPLLRILHIFKNQNIKEDENYDFDNG